MIEPLRIPVGEAIRSKRVSKNLSARAASLAAGLSESYVGKIEKGQAEVSLLAFAKLAQALDFTDREIACVIRWEASRRSE